MNLFMCSFIYHIIFSMSISAKSGLSQDITSPSSRRRVVVFDIDDTLCKSAVLDMYVEIVKKYHPECPIFYWHYTRKSGLADRISHVFLPHLQVLFDYLMERNVRIVFFSAGVWERNFEVIPQLLTSLWGQVKFEALKAKGQFDMFSEKNMREGNKSSRSGEGNVVKDLKVVTREGEALSDAILVDDDPTCCAYDQRPCLLSLNLRHWYIEKLDQKETIGKECDIADYGVWERKSPNFYLNGVYFMIGVFKTYFENDRYTVLPFREALKVILPIKECYIDFFKKHPFAYDMYDLGLLEVQKRVPNATFYGLRHPKIGTYRVELWSKDDSDSNY